MSSDFFEKICLFLYKNYLMGSLVVTPNSAEDLRLLTELLQRLKIKVRMLTPDQEEEMGLGLLLKEVDRNDKVDRSEIIAKLNAA